VSGTEIGSVNLSARCSIGKGKQRAENRLSGSVAVSGRVRIQWSESAAWSGRSLSGNGAERRADWFGRWTPLIVRWLADFHVTFIIHTAFRTLRLCSMLAIERKNKNSSADEIANVNFYAVGPTPGRYPNSLK